MRVQEEKIELQKKVHRRIFVRNTTFLAACPPSYVIFLSLFSSTPSLSSTPILPRKKYFCCRKWWVEGGGRVRVSPPCSSSVYGLVIELCFKSGLYENFFCVFHFSFFRIFSYSFTWFLLFFNFWYFKFTCSVVFGKVIWYSVSYIIIMFLLFEAR